MLSPVYASMCRYRFAALPSTTNAVEACNRISKSSRGPQALQVALLTLYRKDMVVVLRAIAEKACTSTAYEDHTPAALAKRVKTVNAARIRRRRFENEHDDAEGPPDRKSDYKDGKLKRKAAPEKCSMAAKRRKTHNVDKVHALYCAGSFQVACRYSCIVLERTRSYRFLPLERGSLYCITLADTVPLAL